MMQCPHCGGVSFDVTTVGFVPHGPEVVDTVNMATCCGCHRRMLAVVAEVTALRAEVRRLATPPNDHPAVLTAAKALLAETLHCEHWEAYDGVGMGVLEELDKAVRAADAVEEKAAAAEPLMALLWQFQMQDVGEVVETVPGDGGVPLVQRSLRTRVFLVPFIKQGSHVRQARPQEVAGIVHDSDVDSYRATIALSPNKVRLEQLQLDGGVALVEALMAKVGT